MAILKLVQGVDNPILRKRSVPIKKIHKKLLKFFKDALDTLKKENGLGIAAPQLGENVRFFWARLNHESPQEMYVPMINPELSGVSSDMENAEEGCLSVPGVFGIVPRHNSLTVTYYDLKMKKNVLHLTGLNARIMQHEMDHLNGILCVDKMTRKTKRKEEK